MQLYNYYISASTVETLRHDGLERKRTICGLPFTHLKRQGDGEVQLPLDAVHVYSTDKAPVTTSELW